METKAWNGLLIKEFQITKRFLFVSLITILGMIAGVLFLTIRQDEPMIAFTFAILLYVLNSFYLLIYMAISLNVESKRLHLWLHNPQSSYKLLFAKLLNGIFALLISFFVTGLFLWYSASNMFNLSEILEGKVFPFAAFFTINIFGAAIYSSVWLIFIWVIFRIVKSKIRKEFTIILMIILFNIPTALINLFLSTSFMRPIMTWGVLKLDFLNIAIVKENFQIEHGYNMISVGLYVFYFLFTILLFILSNWLIDRKVEV